MTARNYYPFTHAGLVAVDDDCAVRRVDLGTRSHLCGYVALPLTSVPAEWHGNYDADALQYLAVHGGLTYAEKENDAAVFGFDCAHAGDDHDPELRDPVHVMALARQMKQQILAYAERIDEWRAANRERRTEITQEIIDSAARPVDIGFGGMIDMLAGGRVFGGES